MEKVTIGSEELLEALDAIRLHPQRPFICVELYLSKDELATTADALSRMFPSEGSEEGPEDSWSPSEHHSYPYEKHPDFDGCLDTACN